MIPRTTLCIAALLLLATAGLSTTVAAWLPESKTDCSTETTTETRVENASPAAPSRAGSQAAWAEPSPPDRRQLLKDLASTRGEGPRLLTTRADIRTIPDRISRDPKQHRLHDNMRRRADQLLTQPPLSYRPNDGIFLRRGAWEITERSIDLGTTYHLTGDRRYADRLKAELLALCAYPNWSEGNVKDHLNSGNLSAAAAIAYDFCRDALSPQERKQVVETITARSIDPFLTWYSKGVWWTKSTNNWNGVCNGGIGLAALTLIDENDETRDKCSRLLEQVLKSLPTMLRAMDSDGNPFEGTNYQAYGLLNAIDLISSLHHTFGTDYGLSTYPGLKRVGDVDVYLSGNTRGFKFGDDGPSLSVHPRQVFLSRISGSPLSAQRYYRATRYAGTGRDLLSYLEVPEQVSPPSQDLYIRSTEVVGMHTNLLGDDDLFVGFKAGATCAHGDNDRGTFFIEALGQVWAAELGSDNYSLPEYFNTSDDSQKWLYYRKSAQGQNTLVINPGPHADQKASAHCPIVRFQSTPGRGFAIADITPAYPDAASVHRGVRLDRPSGVTTIRDEVHLNAPGDIYWSMHVQDAVFLVMNPRTIQINKEGKVAIVRLTEGEGEFQILPAEPLPGTPAPPGQGNNSSFKKLVIHLSKTKDAILNVTVSPVFDSGEPATPIPEPLEKW